MFTSSRRLRALRSLPLPALLAAVTLAGAALAQTNGDARNSFPGRRIGGGSRGECAARPLVHLVPARSVYAPAGTALVGILEGPSSAPRPLLVEFRPFSAAGSAAAGGSGAPAVATTRRSVPAAPAGITLLTLPGLNGATVWESSYQCGPTATAGTGLDFVSTDAPPALSLLVPKGEAEDLPVRARLQALRDACGGSVDRAVVAAAFGLTDVISEDWPQQLPVRCPG